MVRRTITTELPGWIGDMNISPEGWWLDVHTLVGTIKVPFTAPDGARGVQFSTSERVNAVVTVAVTMDFVEANDV